MFYKLLDLLLLILLTALSATFTLSMPAPASSRVHTLDVRSAAPDKPLTVRAPNSDKISCYKREDQRIDPKEGVMATQDFVPRNDRNEQCTQINPNMAFGYGETQLAKDPNNHVKIMLYAHQNYQLPCQEVHDSAYAILVTCKDFGGAFRFSNDPFVVTTVERIR